MKSVTPCGPEAAAATDRDDADQGRAHEAEQIEAARAELDAGLSVDADDIAAWIDSIGTDAELPPPPTRTR